MPYEATDNAAMMAGYTHPVLIDIGHSSFAALVRPDQDYDDRFHCFDTDNQEWLVVNGWLIETIEDLECTA